MADPRTRAPDLPGFDGPTVAAPTVAPIVGSTFQAPTTGFSTFAAGLNSFFGKTEEGLDAVQKAVQYTQTEELKGQYYMQRAAIAKQEKENKQQAIADALAKQPMNEGLSSNYAYAEAYAETAGKVHGEELKMKFLGEVMPKLGPGDNAAEAYNNFVKTEFGKGTGNPYYDAHALATMNQGIDGALLAHVHNSAKAVMATGLQQADASVVADIQSGNFTADKIPGYLANRRALNPMEPEKAGPELMQIIANAATGNPDAAHTVLAELSKPGSFGPGVSVKQALPAPFAAMEDHLTSHVLNGRGLAAAEQWHTLSQTATTANTFDAWTDKDNGILARAARTRQQYGGLNEEVKFWAETKPILQKFAAATADMNVIDKALKVGPASLNVDEMARLDKAVSTHFLGGDYGGYLQNKGLDPMKNPVEVGQIVGQLNRAPADLKNAMSTALLSGDANSQKAAVAYFDSVRKVNNGNMSATKAQMNEDAKGVYDVIDSRRSTGATLDTILPGVNANLESLKDEDKISWEKITGDTTASAARATATGEVTKALTGSGPFSLFHAGALSNTGESSVTVDPVAQDELLKVYKRNVVINSQTGNTDRQGIADSTLKGLLSSGAWEVLPGINGNVLRPAPFNDRDAAQRPIVRLSPMAPNPDTHQTEDTLATYRTDIQTASGILPRLFTPEQISVSQSTPRGIDGQVPAGSDGVYWLNKADTGQLLIPLGKPLHVSVLSGASSTRPSSALDTAEAAAQGTISGDTKSVMIPADPREAAKVLSGLIPDGHGIVLAPNDPKNPTGFFVGYRPRLTGKSAPEPTAAEMQQKREGFKRLYETPIDTTANPGAIQ